MKKDREEQAMGEAGEAVRESYGKAVLDEGAQLRCTVKWQGRLRLGVVRLGWGDLHQLPDSGQVTYFLSAIVFFVYKIRTMLFALELICICLLV